MYIALWLKLEHRHIYFKHRHRKRGGGARGGASPPPPSFKLGGHRLPPTFHTVYIVNFIAVL